ncbi:hypothetical protein HYZ99_02030 [Candidatus Peregrinibacteria bacterium]|nr:hypothetical protein [Candidatus Peregrinibacteria bacterium]
MTRAARHEAAEGGEKEEGIEQCADARKKREMINLEAEYTRKMKIRLRKKEKNRLREMHLRRRPPAYQLRIGRTSLEEAM